MRVLRLCQFALAATVAALCSPDRLAAQKCGTLHQVQPPSFSKEYEQANLVLFGHFVNAKPGPTPGFGTTDFVIEIAFKKHPIHAGKDRITVPLCAPTAVNKRFLIFCDVERRVIDFYRAIPAEPGDDLPRYFRGLLVLKEQPLAERLRYAFDYFSNPHPEIAWDAYRQFLEAGYKGYRAVAKTLPREKIVAGLRDEKMVPAVRGLHGLLLSECGTAQDGDLLGKLLTQESSMSGTDWLLAARVLLQPNEGWAYLRELLRDGNQDFLQRYSGLRALRFLWDQRPDVIPRADLAAALLPVIAQPDMSDFAIEELRERGCLGMADRILPLFDMDKYQAPIIHRAILRYALCSPSPRAVAFVREQRRLDPRWVSDAEELLALEAQLAADQR